MFGSVLTLLVAVAAIGGAVPSGSASNGDDSIGRATHDDDLFHVLEKRSALDPISTDSAASIAGGQIACGSPPVTSFFAALKPPVP
jgi:hypothetical protein